MDYRQSAKDKAREVTEAGRTVTKGLFENLDTLFQVLGFGISCAMVRDAIDSVERMDGRIFEGTAVDVYHVERDPGHGYGSRDRDQSRDWCAFAANGIGSGPDGSGGSRRVGARFGFRDGTLRQPTSTTLQNSGTGAWLVVSCPVNARGLCQRKMLDNLKPVPRGAGRCTSRKLAALDGTAASAKSRDTKISSHSRVVARYGVEESFAIFGRKRGRGTC